MIYLRFQHEGKVRSGILNGKTVQEITPNFFGEYKKTGKSWLLSKVKLLAPCVPSKVVALGLNYIDHARELKMPIPYQPLLFLKAPSAVIGHGDEIVIPEQSKRVDYEAELAVVIGKKAKNISPRAAADYILGYTCFNDVTARDLQRGDEQWARSKSFDTFAPIGPYIVSGISAAKLSIQAVLNGKTVQRSNTDELIFKIDEIVSYVSQVMTLYPGDVIATGTPPGVGPLSPGDVIQVKIQKIGTLTNKVM